MPPHREVEFYIELVLRETSTPNETCSMSTLELVEFMLQLNKILDKGYIKTSVSPWGVAVFFVKKKDCNLRLCMIISSKQCDNQENESFVEVDDLFR